MTTSDKLSMSLVATSVREALLQQKQLQIVVEEATLSSSCLAFTFFQNLIKSILLLLLSIGPAHSADHLVV